MGSFNEFLRGTGKNKADALAKAWQEYVFENGHRCSLRETESAKLIRKVPPMKPHVEKQTVKTYNSLGYAKNVTQEIHSWQPDPTAPAKDWLEEWEFEVWVHA